MNSWPHRVGILVFDADAGRYLVIRTWRGARLPALWTWQRRGVTLQAARLWVRGRLGVDAVVLQRRTVQVRGIGFTDLLLMEKIGDIRPVLKTEWLSAAEFAALGFTPESTPLLSANVGRSSRAPWTGPGWFVRTEASVRRAIETATGETAANLTQLRTSPMSALLSIEAATTRYYVKAAPLGSVEIQVSEQLSRIASTRVPAVVAADHVHGWMLLNEIPGRPLLDSTNPAVWSGALRAYAALQRQCVPHTEPLAASGCVVRTPVDIRQYVAEGFGRILASWCELGHRLTATTEAHIFADLDRRAAAVAARSLVPMTIDHADLNPCNVQVDGDRYVFLDWCNAAIGHPFYGALVLLQFMVAFHPPLRPRRHAIATAYLEGWSAYATIGELRELLDTMWPLAAVCYVGMRSQLDRRRDAGADTRGGYRRLIEAGMQAVMMACAPAR